MAVNEGSGFRTSHDEALVIDNGPFRADFGSVAEPAGKAWTRPFTSFSNLIVIFVDKQDDAVPRAQVYKLDPNAAITLELQSSSHSETLTFSHETQTLKMAPKNGEFEKATDGRLVDKDENNRKLRIVKITGKTAKGKEINQEIEKDKKKHTFVVITAKPE
jgi:hypothetical protein